MSRKEKNQKINEIIETNSELIEENHELEVEVKEFQKGFKIMIGITLIVAIGLGGGIGYYYVKNKDTQNNLQETTQKVQTAEEKVNEAVKQRAEQELKLAQSNSENQDLKNQAAKKAQEDAVNELKQKEAADIAARKYVVATKKESTVAGLNTRKTPCGELASGLRVWGTAGEVLEGPSKPGPCLGGDYEWYKIKWNDGVEGWSIVNYLDFTGEKQFSQTGYITGYAPIGWDWESQKNTYIPKICATNQSDKITYCNAEINLDQSNYKLVVPTGDYVMSGVHKYKDYETKKILEYPLMYTVLQQCGYTQECYDKYPDGNKKSAVVHVDTGGVLLSVNMYIGF